MLVPLGCKGPHGWHNGRICLPDDEDASVSVLLQPTLKGETGMRKILRDHGVTNTQVQAALRIGAVVHAVSRVLAAEAALAA